MGCLVFDPHSFGYQKKHWFWLTDNPAVKGFGILDKMDMVGVRAIFGLYFELCTCMSSRGHSWVIVHQI